MKRRPDERTADLFAPSPAEVPPGSLACSVEVAHTMSEALRACGRDRYEVAARMSRSLGREVTVAMLNAYTAESRETHNVSLERAIAFDTATDTFALLQLHARKCGATVLRGADCYLAELGRIESQRRELADRERALRVLIRGSK